MIYPLPPPPAGRRWPLAGRIHIAPDIAIAITLFGREAIVYLWRMFTVGMEQWAQGPAAKHR